MGKIDELKDNYELEYSRLKDIIDPLLKDTIDPLTGSPYVLMTPSQYAKNLDKIKNGIAERHACNSCPHNGKCKNINWKSDLEFIEVTKCSGHPDQVKYKGNSTTVVITSVAASCYWSNGRPAPWNWNIMWSALNGTNSGENVLAIGYYDNSIDAFLYRCFFYYPTDSILPSSNIISSNIRVYNFVKNLTVHDTGIVMSTGSTVPHFPYGGGAWPSDYDKANFSGNYGTFTVASMTLNAYNDIPITDLSIITKGGKTRFGMRWIDDINNIDPGSGGGSQSCNFWGSIGAFPPQLEITFNPLKSPEPIVGVTGDFDKMMEAP